MIKLSRSPAPAYLSANTVAELTSKFKATGDSVWNRDEIKIPLLASSQSKCAYCECRLDEECKYMEVEHYRDKDRNPDMVVEWVNLLPSCKRCNGAKGGHDVDGDPIINPFEIDPRNHLLFRAYRFRAASSLGASSIDVLDLNHSVRVVAQRFKVGEIIIEGLEQASERRSAWLSSGTTRARNALVRAIEAVLLECQPGSEYSATAATVLHKDELYKELVAFMRANDLWSDQLAALHAASEGLALAVA